MAVKVLIVGESGAGKSASLRNFEPNEVAIFNVSEKPLPFPQKASGSEHFRHEESEGSHQAE